MTPEERAEDLLRRIAERRADQWTRKAVSIQMIAEEIRAAELRGKDAK